MTTKKYNKDTTSQVSIIKRVEMLSVGLSQLRKLHDDNSVRGNKAFDELGKKLDQCNFITQDTFLKNNFELMMRIVALEKRADSNRDILNNQWHPTLQKMAERMNALEKDNNESLNSNKPQVGEIWKTKGGNNFLIKEISGRPSQHYYRGEVVDIKAYWFRCPALKISDNFDSPVFVLGDLIEKIC